jgi:hypothetical protein
MPANTYTLIEKIVVGSGGAATATFTNIPQTYTDLQIFASARSERTTGGTDGLNLKINDSTSSYSWRSIYGDGSAAVSENATSRLVSYLPQDGGSVGWTANTFANISIYIPNYTSSNNKSYSVDAVTENNGTLTYDQLYAALWSNTSAITKLEFSGSNGLDLTQYSTFYLYGIAKEGVSPSPSSAPYATGGDSIVFDGTYWIHTFTSSGTFTPKKGLTCDYLVVAGGGGGGGTASDAAGGGGAGGLRCTVGATGGGGSLESALSLTASTNYTVTVGAGGAGGAASDTSTGKGTNGSNSVFSSITSTGGGGGGSITVAGGSGGSGGGNGAQTSGGGGAGTANQGYAGGSSANINNSQGGGGGGAGAVGTNGANVSTSGVAGGIGVATSISGSSTYYAGGGGGGPSNGASAGAVAGAGGLGGGGGGGTTNAAGTSGTANTGGGGGASNRIAGGAASGGGAGGSGIVIVRYAA